VAVGRVRGYATISEAANSFSLLSSVSSDFRIADCQLLFNTLLPRGEGVGRSG